MRARLIVLFMLLMSVAVLALGIPLAATIRSSLTHDVFLNRVNDTARFASIAEQDDAIGQLALIMPELERYTFVYGIDCFVVATDGTVRLASSQRLGPPADEGATERISNALGGRRSDTTATQWPWDARPLVVAEPMIRGGDVVGALVTVSPTANLRHRVLVAWVLVAAGGVLLLIAGFFLADRLARWVLRPVRVLDAATREVADGRLATRVADSAGPPELQHLVSSFNDMADHVQASLERQRAFVADASHQLRNPLSALLIRLDDLADRARHAARADRRDDVATGISEEAERAMDEGRRLVGMLERLLELAEAEQAPAHAADRDVAPLVDERVEAWQPIARARRIALVRGGEPHLPAFADEAAVVGGLDVLIDNALKFSPPDSTVTVTVSAEPGRSVVSVRDHGPGLRPDELSRAGDRFWRGPTQQNVDGFGLGLSIARALLEPAGGALEFSSPDGGGLQVALVLPALSASSSGTS